MRARRFSTFFFAVACAAALCSATVAASEAGYADPDGRSLKAGQFAWLPGAEAYSDAPVTLLVNLRDQRAFVYRDGQRIAVTTVSTGRRGHDTPVGVFPIMGKSKVHYSNRYNNAPMPYMQRLTDWGHALHAGDVRPYPASHGCIRLPHQFAKRLFELTDRGDLVVIAQDDSPKALAIALKVAEMDPSTALAFGVTEPLPHIVWQHEVAGSMQDGASD
jgi:lipoprotein-anchoring transpeptidase ErfK/SrfK